VCQPYSLSPALLPNQKYEISDWASNDWKSESSDSNRPKHLCARCDSPVKEEAIVRKLLCANVDVPSLILRP